MSTTDIKNDRALRALTKLVYFYWEWFDLSVQDTRAGRRRKVTEVSYAKFYGYAEAMNVLFGLSTPTRVELDLRDYFRQRTPPERSIASSAFAIKRDAWVNGAIDHFYVAWNISDGLS